MRDWGRGKKFLSPTASDLIRSYGVARSKVIQYELTTGKKASTPQQKLYLDLYRRFHLLF